MRVRESTSQQRQAVLAYYKFDRLNVGIYVIMCVCVCVGTCVIYEWRRREETRLRRPNAVTSQQSLKNAHAAATVVVYCSGAPLVRKKMNIYMFLYIGLCI